MPVKPPLLYDSSQLWFCNRRANLGGLVISWSRTAL